MKGKGIEAIDIISKVSYNPNLKMHFDLICTFRKMQYVKYEYWWSCDCVQQIKKITAITEGWC